jgi:hypothetical protein
VLSDTAVKMVADAIPGHSFGEVSGAMRSARISQRSWTSSGRLIESGIERGDPEYARGILDEVHNLVRPVRKELPTPSAINVRCRLRNPPKM